MAKKNKSKTKKIRTRRHHGKNGNRLTSKAAVSSNGPSSGEGRQGDAADEALFQTKYPMRMDSVFFREQPVGGSVGNFDFGFGRARALVVFPRLFFLTDPAIGARQGFGLIATLFGWTAFFQYEDPVDYRSGIAHVGEFRLDDVFRRVS